MVVYQEGNRDIKSYNVEGFLSKITPDFELVNFGNRLDGADFVKNLTDQKASRGPAETQENRFAYKLVDFKSLTSATMAFVSFNEIGAGTDSGNAMVLVLEGDKWLVDRFVHDVVHGRETNQ